MKPLFKQKERFSLGLDIGTYAIKMVKLRFAQGAIELCGFSIEPNQLDLTEPLKKVKQSQRQEAANIAACGPATVIRYIIFPKMNALELRQALKFEAQKHIPFSIDEINLDGCILKEDLPENKMLVLIAAVKKEFITQRLKIMEEAGLKANIVDIDSLALINAFNFNYPQDTQGDNLKHKAAALLNIGSSVTNLNILENGVPRLSRDIHVAGNNFTQKIMDIFSIDFKSAEDLKLSPDGERSKKVIAALEALFSDLAGSIRTSFDYYESQGASSVTRIFLSGGGSKLIGLKDILANLLGIEVEYWDPLKQVSLTADIDAQRIKELSGQLAVAVGLALRQ